MRPTSSKPQLSPILKALGGLSLLAALVLVQLGCSRQEDASPEAALAKETKVFIGDEEFIVQAVPTGTGENADKVSSDQESNAPSLEAGPNQKALDQGDQPAPTPIPTPKPTPKPIDIEFILTKAKDISVGLTSDLVKPRIVNDAKPFIPASVTKVITTAVALSELGVDFRFQTKIAFKKDGDKVTGLAILADGDPTPGMRGEAGDLQRVEKIATEFKSRGVRVIEGEILMVPADLRLETSQVAPGVPDEDLRECYGALATSFNFRSNCALVRVNSKNGFTWEAAGIGDRVETEVNTTPGSKTSLALEVLIDPLRTLLGYRLNGSYIEKAPRGLALRLPVVNGAGWFASALMLAFRNAKINVSNTTLKYVMTHNEHQAAMKLFSGDDTILVQSPPLSLLVEATNKPSDNFLADSLFKAIGIRKGQSEASARAGGQEVVARALKIWMNRDGKTDWDNELHFIDGAGLSVENRATPRAYLSILRQLTKEPMFSALWQSLPIAGTDGTLADRMRNTKVDGLVRGKTGTLKGSYQLVGYIPKKKSGQIIDYIPFVILTATTERNRDRVRDFQDALVVKMAESAAK